MILSKKIVKNEILQIETKIVYFYRLSDYLILFINHTYKKVSKQPHFLIYVVPQKAKLMILGRSPLVFPPITIR